MRLRVLRAERGARRETLHAKAVAALILVVRADGRIELSVLRVTVLGVRRVTV